MLVKDPADRAAIAIAVVASGVGGATIMRWDDVPLSLRLLIAVIGAAVIALATRASLDHRRRRRRRMR